jgi:hypothetical protein
VRQSVQDAWHLRYALALSNGNLALYRIDCPDPRRNTK